MYGWAFVRKKKKWTREDEKTQPKTTPLHCFMIFRSRPVASVDLVITWSRCPSRAESCIVGVSCRDRRPFAVTCLRDFLASGREGSRKVVVSGHIFGRKIIFPHQTKRRLIYRYEYRIAIRMYIGSLSSSAFVCGVCVWWCRYGMVMVTAVMSREQTPSNLS